MNETLYWKFIYIALKTMELSENLFNIKVWHVFFFCSYEILDTWIGVACFTSVWIWLLRLRKWVSSSTSLTDRVSWSAAAVTTASIWGKKKKKKKKKKIEVSPKRRHTKERAAACTVQLSVCLLGWICVCLYVCLFVCLSEHLHVECLLIRKQFFSLFLLSELSELCYSSTKNLKKC